MNASRSMWTDAHVVGGSMKRKSGATNVHGILTRWHTCSDLDQTGKHSVPKAHAETAHITGPLGRVSQLSGNRGRDVLPTGRQASCPRLLHRSQANMPGVRRSSPMPSIWLGRTLWCLGRYQPRRTQRTQINCRRRRVTSSVASQHCGNLGPNGIVCDIRRGHVGGHAGMDSQGRWFFW